MKNGLSLKSVYLVFITYLTKHPEDPALIQDLSIVIRKPEIFCPYVFPFEC